MKHFLVFTLAAALGAFSAPSSPFGDCAAGGGCAAAASPAAENEVQVVKTGKVWGSIEAYRIGNDFYLSAKDGARIFAGQLYWYAVRGMIRMSFRGRQIVLTQGADEGLFDGKKKKLGRPMIVRAGKAFVPAEFFTSEDFSRVSGVNSKFDPKTRLLLVDHRSTVGPIRWFTYPEHTRVVLELDSKLRFQTGQRGRAGMDVTIPNGMIAAPARLDVGDGVLEYLDLTQEKKQARLVLKSQGGADGYKILELQNPRRLVIDIARAKDQILAAKNQRIGYEAPASPKQERREAAHALKLSQQNGKDAAVEAPAPAAASEPAIVASAAAPAAAALPFGRRFRIMVDPGHGGKDGGAVGRRGTLEKDINLKASQELVSLLRREDAFDVRLTRDSDEFIKLKNRSKLANDFNADLFISVHCNAAEQRSLTGFEVYTLNEKASDPGAERIAEFENSVLALEGEDIVRDEATEILYGLAKTEFINDSLELAGLMTRSLSTRVDLRNRGVKQAAFYVLRGANQAAVLVEMAFLSNGRDESKLKSDKYRRKIVEGMHDGILDFVRRKGVSGAKR